MLGLALLWIFLSKARLLNMRVITRNIVTTSLRAKRSFPVAKGAQSALVAEHILATLDNETQLAVDVVQRQQASPDTGGPEHKTGRQQLLIVTCALCFAPGCAAMDTARARTPPIPSPAHSRPCTREMGTTSLSIAQG